MMRSDTPPVIYDARPAEIRRREPYRIAGAIALDLDSPDRADQLYSEHEVVVYCVCPNEATAKTIARQLRAKGFRHVRPLKGGLDAWEKHGYPVEPMPAEHLHAAADQDDIDHDMVTIRATAPE
jgi:rhodanese-related sulfurtransferase